VLKIEVSPRVAMAVFLACTFIGITSVAAQDPQKISPAVTVDFRCKLIGVKGDPARMPWFVELRNSASEPMRQTLSMAGSTVTFKDLTPGIYMVCLSGKQDRKRCESVDLTPPPEMKDAEFSKEFQLPKAPSQVSNFYQVSVRALKIPKKALDELKHAVKEQLGGNIKEMMSHLTRAVEIYPDYADAWNNLGAQYHRSGNYQRSIASFTRVTELEPNSHLGWMNLGGSLIATGNFEKALVANKKAVSLDPKDVIANSQLAMTYYYLHNYTEAKKYFRRVFNLDPAYANSPQLYLAHIALGEDSPGEAAEYLTSFLEYHPNAPNAPEARERLKKLSEGELVAAHPPKK